MAAATGFWIYLLVIILAMMITIGMVLVVPLDDYLNVPESLKHVVVPVLVISSAFFLLKLPLDFTRTFNGKFINIFSKLGLEKSNGLYNTLEVVINKDSFPDIIIGNHGLIPMGLPGHGANTSIKYDSELNSTLAIRYSFAPQKSLDLYYSNAAGIQDIGQLFHPLSY